MKRFNLHIGAFLTLALAVSSCAEEELVKDYFVPTPSNTITFGASDLQVEVRSRSGKSNNAILSTTESKLVSEDGKNSLPMLVQVQEGIHRIGEAAPASRGDKMENEDNISTLYAWATHSSTGQYITSIPFNKNNTDKIFYSEEPYPWPGNGGTLDFLTVVNKPTDNFTPNFVDNQIVSFDYTVPANAADQPDILIAQASASADAGEGENPFGVSVPLDFKHIMAAVNVKVGTLAVTGTINSVTIKGVWDKATCVLADNKWIAQTGSTLGSDGRPVGANFKIFEGNLDMEEGIQINSLENTLMMIPQTLPSGAEVELTITDNNQKVHILRASIQGDKWDSNTTTNYLINIDGSYNMQIVALDKVIDSHYIMTKVEVSVTNINKWVLEVSSKFEDENTNEPAGTVTILPENLVNPMAKQGYWTDKLSKPIKVGDKVVGYEPTADSARGTNTYEGSGDLNNEVFYVFIPENISGKTRNITVTLRQTDGTANKELPLIQQPIKWISPNGSTILDNTFLGAELLLENGIVPWGFSWTGVKEEFVYKDGGSGSPWGQIKNYVLPAYDRGGIDYKNLPPYISMVTTQAQHKEVIILTIDYGQLALAVNVGRSDNDGLLNTWGMYSFDVTGEDENVSNSSGLGYIATLKNVVAGMENVNYASDSGPVELASTQNFAALNALKRNKFNLYQEITTGVSVNLPIIELVDVNWYLPAKEQFTETIANTYWGQDFPWSDYYWTSTIVLDENNSETDTDQAYIFSNGAVSPEVRTNNHQAMAVRRYTNDVQYNVNDIVQSGTGNTNQQ